MLLECDDNGYSKNVIGLSPYTYDNGAKLMEHSYVGNGYVDAFIRLLEMKADPEKGCRVAWVGDYADDVLQERTFACPDTEKVMFLYWAYVNAWKYPGDDFDNAMDLDDLPDLPYEEMVHSRTGAIIDFDKKMYVRIVEDSKEELQIHPLPLLTAVGNGLGGGDYYDSNPDYFYVGYWAGDHILWVNDEDLDDYITAYNLTELEVHFKE
jgi:hypothetical protein